MNNWLLCSLLFITFSMPISTMAQACIPGPGQVALFRHANFEGDCSILAAGSYTDEQGLGLPNDTVSSLRVGENAIADLCWHINFEGTCEPFTADDPNPSDNIVGNDTASSARVLAGSTDCNPVSDEVALFLHSDYGGYCTILEKGFYRDAHTATGKVISPWKREVELLPIVISPKCTFDLHLRLSL